MDEEDFRADTEERERDGEAKYSDKVT